MATVVDRAGQAPTLDKTLVDPNRFNAGDPNGVLTPQFSGEIILDTTNKKLWQAQTLNNAHWVPIARLTHT